ncbi:sugar ABC transporter substrate-binding protein [Paenibacillus sp. BK720]|uniref:ABC transporter substrate-binding protein n=1 Tax=Paenibacillus sp. BK720 TaxID=2587092 RepID=UPI001424334D|nr:sugar ABC transporter substrate-binding protein [Paenibacillus sp. BK720]NIK67249.1 ABC-type glycerol-3-phosphate transport system substrate-binding protein [Paenibacillus sp. BK720]
MTKKRISMMLFSVMMLFTLILSACSNNNSKPNNSPSNSPAESAAASTEASEQPSDEPITLTYIRGSAVSPNEQKVLDMFHAKYPNITINIALADGGGVGDMLEKATALQAAGTPADIIWVQDTIPFAKDNLLVDLSPYMKSDPVLSTAKIPASSLEALQFKGQQLGIPRAENPIIVYVNKDLLAKHGIDMPANNWTWDDYREIAKKVTDPSVGEYGISYGQFNSIITAGVIGVDNGTSPNLYFMDQDWKQSLLTTPEAKADIEWIKNLQDVDHSIGLWADLEKSGSGWMKGNVAFEIHGVWEGRNKRENAKFNWDVLPLPGGKAKQVGYTVGTGIGVLSGSKHQDAAVKYLAFMNTIEAQKVMLENGDFPLTEDQELKDALVETSIWKGTNILATIGVEMRAEPVGKIVGASEYVQWWSDEVQHAFKEGEDPNKPIFEQAAHFNEYTLGLRKELGLD